MDLRFGGLQSAKSKEIRIKYKCITYYIMETI